MGNSGSSNSNRSARRRRQAGGSVASSQYVVAAPSQYRNPNSTSNYYHNYINNGNDINRCGALVGPPPPQLERQRAVTVKIEVNVKRDTIALHEDPENSGRFLLAFTYDALSRGSITVAFFAKEGEDCNLISTKEDCIKPIRMPFEEGLGQEFRQPSGTGIELSAFDLMELKEVDEEGAYPLVVKLEAASTKSIPDNASRGNSSINCYIALAVFGWEKGKYVARVMKQILWVNSVRHELQEIYGIGNSVDGESEDGDPGKECVICMAEPRDTTVLPCRHMCLCSGCAKVLHLQKQYRCPLCRQRVERLLEIMVSDET